MLDLTPTSPRSFTFFSRLPQELRNRIWQFAASEPRLLSISSFLPVPENLNLRYLCSHQTVPAVLHACHNSRSESSTLYIKAFSTNDRERYIWASFSVDTIQIPDHLLPLISRNEREQIRRLTVEVNDTDLFNWYHYPWDFEMMGSIRELTILSEPKLSKWGYTIERLMESFELWFGSTTGWKAPRLKIMERETGAEMNMQNCAAIAARSLGRGLGVYTPTSRGGRGGHSG